MRTFVLKPRPPLRAFVLAAVVSMVGAVLITVAAANGWPTPWLVLCILVLAAGVLLCLAAVWSMWRMRTMVEVTDDGYTIRTPGAVRSGRWDEVTKVTQATNGAHITLYHGQVTRTHILSPGNVATAEMEALGAEIARRMDANRYGTIDPALLAPAPVEVADQEQPGPSSGDDEALDAAEQE